MKEPEEYSKHIGLYNAQKQGVRTFKNISLSNVFIAKTIKIISYLT